MKKITPGQGPVPVLGVKSEAGQIPSLVVMFNSRRGIGLLSILPASGLSDISLWWQFCQSHANSFSFPAMF
jgi:hypothetical protein